MMLSFRLDVSSWVLKTRPTQDAVTSLMFCFFYDAGTKKASKVLFLLKDWHFVSWGTRWKISWELVGRLGKGKPKGPGEREAAAPRGGTRLAPAQG